MTMTTKVMVNGEAITMRALTPQEKAEMAEERPTRDALRRYLDPLPTTARIEARRRLNGVVNQIALRMEHGHGGDTLTRAEARLARFEREADELALEGRTPSRFHDLRRAAAARLFWMFRDRIEHPVGLLHRPYQSRSSTSARINPTTF